jgi:hypothetical protein
LEVRAIRTKIAKQFNYCDIIEEQLEPAGVIKSQTDVLAELARRRSR